MPATNRLRAFVLGSAVILAASASHAQQADNSTPAAAAAETVVAAKTDAPAAEFGVLDGARNWAKRHQLLERLEGRVDGWYPRLGGMTRGSGFTFGPGYRTHVLGDRVLVDASAAMST